MNAVAEKENPTTATEPSRERPFVSPDVNIYETSDGYVLEAEMPGVTKGGLEITLEANTLTIVGRRDDEVATGSPLYRESHATNYRRVFELDPAIAAEKIGAEMQQGLLTLTLPKAESAKPRRIQIQ
jgi:HSP20 family molecular chaperone IbpA